MVSPDILKVTGKTDSDDDESSHKKRRLDIDANDHRKIRDQKHSNYEIQSSP